MTKNICNKLGATYEDGFYKACIFTDRDTLMATEKLKTNCETTGGTWAYHKYCNCPTDSTVLSQTTGKCVPNDDAENTAWRKLCIELGGVFNPNIDTCTVISNQITYKNLFSSLKSYHILHTKSIKISFTKTVVYGII